MRRPCTAGGWMPRGRGTAPPLRTRSCGLPTRRATRCARALVRERLVPCAALEAPQPRLPRPSTPSKQRPKTPLSDMIPPSPHPPPTHHPRSSWSPRGAPPPSSTSKASPPAYPSACSSRCSTPCPASRHARCCDPRTQVRRRWRGGGGGAALGEGGQKGVPPSTHRPASTPPTPPTHTHTPPVEYDYLPAHQCHASLETKRVSGLFFSGQLNGTTGALWGRRQRRGGWHGGPPQPGACQPGTCSPLPRCPATHSSPAGYEEAAAQGLVAGLNAARRAAGQEPVVLPRESSYIGGWGVACPGAGAAAAPACRRLPGTQRGLGTPHTWPPHVPPTRGVPQVPCWTTWSPRTCGSRTAC